MYEITNIRNNSRTLLSCAFVFVVTYAALYLSIGGPFDIPHGSAYAVVLVWAAAHVGAGLAAQVHMPPLLGMLLTGILLNNANSEILHPYKHSWQKKIKSAGLATILLRAGLKIDFHKAFRRAPTTTSLLGAVPVLVDGFLAAAVFHGMLGMPFVVAALGGFVVAPISPNIMITGMLELMQQGLSMARGIPSIEMAATGVDIVVGLAGYSIFEGLTFASSLENPAWGLAKGPAQVGLGMVAGLVAGTVVGCTKLWHLQLPLTFATFGLAQMMVFLFDHYMMTGAGALAAIAVGGAAGVMWRKGFPAILSSGRQPELRNVVDSHVCLFWDWVMQPLLFGTIGAGVDISKINLAALRTAVVVIVVGTLARWCTSLLCVLPGKFTWKESAFVVLSWIPKATVQGLLASAPLDAFMARLDHTAPDFHRYLEWGNAIQATAVLAIIITAPAGLLIQSWLAPRWLEKDPTPGSDAPPQQAEAIVNVEIISRGSESKGSGRIILNARVLPEPADVSPLSSSRHISSSLNSRASSQSAVRPLLASGRLFFGASQGNPNADTLPERPRLSPLLSSGRHEFAAARSRLDAVAMPEPTILSPLFSGRHEFISQNSSMH